MSLEALWKIFDVKVIDGLVNGSARSIAVWAESIRKIQTGIAQNYALLMMIGIVGIIAWMILG
jgi:NADH-quinone oxidoreductase subunit L